MGLKERLLSNPAITKIINQMYNSLGQEGQQAYMSKIGLTPEEISTIGTDGFSSVINDGQGMTLGELGKLSLSAAKAHPFKTAGLIGLGAGNIGGLMDNDKFGGQLAGLGLGGLGAATLMSGNPYGAAMMTMGGGALGSLFDKLRARKEQEQSNIINPNQNTPRLPGKVY